MTYDIAIAGLGGIGSAIAAHCARRGVRVIGLEQFAAGHELGSSSGRTRLIRQAYFEDAAYVPLVLRAYALWRELEREAGEELLRLTGLVTVGEEESDIVRGTLRAAATYGLRVDSLGKKEVARRFPAVCLTAEDHVLWEADGGVLWPERATAAHQALARRHGAELRFDTPLQRWEAEGAGFVLHLGEGATVRAKRLILALGPWVKDTLAQLGITLRVQRNVQAWFAPANSAYDAPAFPAFLLSRRGLPAALYGFPNFGPGVKAAFHGLGEITTAGELRREIDLARDVEPLRRAMEAWMPGATQRFLEAKACMYSLTEDEHFIVDRHPAYANLLLCGGFSGHGFKFAPVIGEIAASLALDGGTEHPIEFLSLQRFRPSAAAAAASLA